ncbi:MAG: adenylate/guanylate cyclase domain-containing protein, partial [Prevotellaceae bacterium]
MKKVWKISVCAALIAMILTGFAALGILKYSDLAASDAMYQSRSTPDGEIVLVGIDQRAIEEIGPYEQWGRDVMATVLDTLNESEECHPAAIALDILYTSERDAGTDEWLAEAAGKYGNVVTAGAARFGTSMTEEENGEYGLDTFSVLEFEEPYEALAKATTRGHINVMLDGTDGVLRHHLLSFSLADGTEVPSLAL